MMDADSNNYSFEIDLNKYKEFDSSFQQFKEPLFISNQEIQCILNDKSEELKEEDDDLTDYPAITRDQNKTASPQTDIDSGFFVPEIKMFGSITRIDVDESYFIVILKEEQSDLKFEYKISNDDINVEDLDKIQVGAKIIYTYGKQYTHGTAFNTSRIIFRSIQKWNPYKLNLMKKNAGDILELLSSK